jgi:C-terminal processing protease CtpA/Prc
MNSSSLAILTSFVLSSALVAEPAAELFKKLNADNYVERHKAQLELAAWSVANTDEAIELFFKEYKAAATPEVKVRVGQLLRERVVFEKYGRATGFVGIRMDNGAEKVGGELRSVVLVTNVVEGSPADIFGLKQGDAIWRIDQQVFNRNGFASLQFIDIVISKREGDAVVIDLVRNGKPIVVKLVLGAMPAELERMNNLRANKDPELDKENYFNNWLQNKLRAEKPKSEAAVE